ncbi:hypothetical protein [Actinacidiphila yeochonensis]|uniref:hypothetical protein n=1 Tax=Actinacidiphila yeochonensis TaxID=89050 RepID=UPI0005646CC9|nr:hypothetical protein [Actinacidiphila yeochonensis]
MAISDDIVKGLRNPTPLYAVAGTADLAAEKLKEVPALLDRLREEAPGRFEKLRATDPKEVQERVTTGAKDAQTRLTAGAKDAQARLTGTFADLDLKELRDFRKLGESVQDLALQGVGRAAEYAVRTRETYDGLAERGKGAVAKWRGADEEAEDEPGQITAGGTAGTAGTSDARSTASGSGRRSTGGTAKTSRDGAAPAARKPAARKAAPKKPTE